MNPEEHFLKVRKITWMFALWDVDSLALANPVYPLCALLGIAFDDFTEEALEGLFFDGCQSHCHADIYEHDL